MENICTFVKPDQTTMVEIVLRRVVRAGVFELTRNLGAVDFRGQGRGGVVG